MRGAVIATSVQMLSGCTLGSGAPLSREVTVSMPSVLAWSHLGHVPPSEHPIWRKTGASGSLTEGEVLSDKGSRNCLKRSRSRRWGCLFGKTKDKNKNKKLSCYSLSKWLLEGQQWLTQVAKRPGRNIDETNTGMSQTRARKERTKLEPDWATRNVT